MTNVIARPALVGRSNLTEVATPRLRRGSRRPPLIAVVDYGMGNLASVEKALRFLGGRAQITSSPQVMRRSRALVFPGVGAFGEAMRELKTRRLVDPILEGIRQDKPFLGLCLGLQLLFDVSEESPGMKGLSVFPGRVRRLPAGRNLKIPHMGWNQVEKVQRSAKGVSFTGRYSLAAGRSLLEGVPEGAFMYFVHSYYADPKEEKVVMAKTRYGTLFPSILWNGRRLWATQFHPEKSQRHGLRILKNFLKQVERC